MEIGVTQTIQKRLKNQDIHQPYEQTTELAFCWGVGYNRDNQRKL